MPKEPLAAQQTDLDRERLQQIRLHMSGHIQNVVSRSQRLIKKGKFGQVGCNLKDAGDWVLILGYMDIGYISTMDQLKERLYKLDTDSRDPWFMFIDQLENPENSG
jgi:hypothetical protein